MVEFNGQNLYLNESRGVTPVTTPLKKHPNSNILKTQLEEEESKIVAWEDSELSSSHKHIRFTAIYELFSFKNDLKTR